MRALWVGWLLLSCWFGSPSVARAHPLGFGTAELVLEPGEFSGELVLDSPPEFANDEPLDATAMALRKSTLRHQIETGFVLLIDGQEVKTHARVVSLGSGPTAIDIVEVSGTLPQDAKELTVRVGYDVGDVGIEVAGSSVNGRLRRLVIKDSRSPVIYLNQASAAQTWERVDRAERGTKTLATRPVASATLASPTEIAGRPERSRGWALGFAEYFMLGFRHIVPGGLDHILFVVGLLLANSLHEGKWRWLKRLSLQLSVFTLAHSVTLVLGASGMVTVNAGLVEPLIALSIVYVGLEPVLLGLRKGASPRGGSWQRSALVFGFGLLHGLGFAAALSNKGLSVDARASSLLAFNLGVEAGQLAIAIAVGALCFSVRQRPKYFAWGVAPAGFAIAAVGIFWFATRIA